MGWGGKGLGGGGYEGWLTRGSIQRVGVGLFPWEISDANLFRYSFLGELDPDRELIQTGKKKHRRRKQKQVGNETTITQ